MARRYKRNVIGYSRRSFEGLTTDAVPARMDHAQFVPLVGDVCQSQWLIHEVFGKPKSAL